MKLPLGLTLAVQLLLAAIVGVLSVTLAAPLTAALVGIAQALLAEETRQAVEKVPALCSSCEVE